jgi:hypothetical protein
MTSCVRRHVDRSNVNADDEITMNEAINDGPPPYTATATITTQIDK